MYELNDPERNPLTTAPCFPPFYRGERKLRARPTLHMLIQRRLRANEERSLNARDGAGMHPFSDRSAN